MTLRSIAFFLAFAALAAAADHPDFSGTWNLNLAESDFTDKHASAPTSLVLTVHQHGDDFRYDSVREKDGKKSRGHLDVVIGLAHQPGGDGTASAEWKADQLEFKLLNNAGQPTEFEAVDTWSLSGDRKKLTSDYVVHLPKAGGEYRVRRVFDKKN
jgi:hypothetical protein